MPENQKNNEFIMETLIQISKDVSEINAKVDNLEKNTEKSNTVFEKRLVEVENKTKENSEKIQGLENADNKKDADKYRKILAIIGAGVTGLLIGNFSSIVRFFISLFTK